MALTPVQLTARTNRIGSSDAAAVCGQPAHNTAYEVALRIRGELPPNTALDDKDFILFGDEMEGVLARVYEKKHPGVVLEIPDTVVHPKYPFIAANIDRRVKGNPKLALEMKNTGLHVQDTWGRAGTDEVPVRVLMQVQHCMFVCPEIEAFGVLRCYGGNSFQEFVVPRHPGLIESIEQIEVEFWENLQKGILPEPDWEHGSTKGTLKRAFQKIHGVIEARDDLIHWTSCWEEATAARLQAEKLEVALKNRIVQMMGNTEIAMLSDGTRWVRKLVTRNGFVVEPSSYVETRRIKPRGKKGAQADESDGNSIALTDQREVAGE